MYISFQSNVVFYILFVPTRQQYFIACIICPFIQYILSPTQIVVIISQCSFQHFVILISIIALEKIIIIDKLYIQIQNKKSGKLVEGMQIYDEDYFESEFEKNFLNLGAEVYKKYQPVIQNYKRNIIPFEKKRINENQSLIFENSTLQKNKIQLLSKIQQLSAQNHNHEQLIESQANKIFQLSRAKQQLEKNKKENEVKIQQLQTQIKQLNVSLQMKVEAVKIIEQDKQQVSKMYEQRNNEYNVLLSNYMRDKHNLAERLNSMNDLQLRIMQKQKDLKAEGFYLQKQWQQLQQQKKSTPKQKSQKTPSITPNRQSMIVNKRTSVFSKEQAFKDDKKKQDNHSHSGQILKTPLKKIYKYHQSEVYSLSFNYNGSLLSSCGGDRCIRIYDTMNLRPSGTIESNSAENIFLSCVLNYGGEKLLTGGTDKTVTIYQTNSGKPLHSFVGHGEKVNSVTWSSSRQKCASGSQDKQIKVWQIEKASNLLSIACGKSVKYLTANTVQPVVYSGHSDGSIRIYSMTQGKVPVAQIKGIIDYPINYISLLSNKYQALVSSAEGSTMHLMDMKMNKSIAKYQHHDFFNTMVQADISPSQSYVVAGNCDGSIYYWNTNKKTFEKRVTGHDGPISTLRSNFMSGILASADKQGNLIIWQ